MQFAFLAGVNQGIIASIFSTSIVFSAIVFYFMYQESLSHRHLIGILFFIVCVVLISVGKAHRDIPSVSSTEPFNSTEQDKYLYFAVVMALGSSLILTVNGIVMRHYCKYVKISPLQLNNDGALFQFVVLLALYYYQVTSHADGFYTWFDIFESVSGSLISTLGNVVLSHALAIGLGGPVQGIANLQSVVHLVLALLLLNQVPTMLQYMGMSVGLVGALIITGIDKAFVETCSKDSSKV